MKLSGWVNDEMKGKNGEDMGACVVRYDPLIRRQARRFIVDHSLPVTVSIDEFIQEGRIKLVECHQRYDPNGGATFETYLTVSLDGCFIDYLREIDTISRSQRRKIRKLTRCIDGSPRIERTKLTRQLGITYEELEELFLLENFSHLTSLDFTVSVSGVEETSRLDMYADSRNDPEMLFAVQEIIERIVYMLEKQLTGNRDQAEQVFEMYFFEGKNFREIGESLGVGESRVCQVMGSVRDIITTVLKE